MGSWRSYFITSFSQNIWCVLRVVQEVPQLRRNKMSLGMILLIVLILLLLGAVPSWPHSRSWGYGPSGILGVVLIVIIILLVMGRI